MDLSQPAEHTTAEPQARQPVPVNPEPRASDADRERAAALLQAVYCPRGR
jgi:hypothetical protein